MASIAQIINALPRPIRLRFDSIGSYVQGILSDEQESLPKEMHLKAEELELIKLLVFCHAANRFFREGSEAARTAVDIFQEFKISGFQVGSTPFEGRNRNVMMGDHLAEHLMRSFEGSPLKRYVTSDISVSDLVHTLSRKIRHERRLG